MPLGHGYWVNARTGDEIEITEHLDAVFADPARFGLNPDDPMLKKGRSPEARKEILTDVIRRGWIRVRLHRNQYTFEAWKITDDVLYSILEFTQRHKFWRDEYVDIHEVGRAGGGMHSTVGELQQQFQPALVGEVLERRSSCPVFEVRITAVEGALSALAKHLDRINDYSMGYITEKANGEWCLEAHNWSADSGYHTSPEALLALLHGVRGIVESDARKGELDVHVRFESDRLA